MRLREIIRRCRKQDKLIELLIPLKYYLPFWAMTLILVEKEEVMTALVEREGVMTVLGEIEGVVTVLVEGEEVMTVLGEMEGVMTVLV